MFFPPSVFFLPSLTDISVLAAAQCVWKTTKKVGIASARDSKGGL